MPVHLIEVVRWLVHDPNDPVGRLLYNVLAMIAEFELDFTRLRTPPHSSSMGLTQNLTLNNEADRVLPVAEPAKSHGVHLLSEWVFS